MPSCFVCLVAKSVVRDADTNQISVFNIFEDILPLGLPIFIPELAVLTMWRREDGDADQVEVQLKIANNEDVVATQVLTLDFRNNAPNHRSIVNISPLIIKQIGRVTFEYKAGENTLANYSMNVLPPDQMIVAEAPG